MSDGTFKTHKEKVTWLGLEAPRYTSYPPAHHFSSQVNCNQHTQYLRSLDQNTAVSAYVHVPFCRELCWFCGCHTKATQSYKPVANYVRYLLKEIDIIRQIKQGCGRLINIHFGGGSPNLLETQDLFNILHALSNTFENDSLIERAIELDPRTTTSENISSYANFGFNRVSIGIQDFNEEVQRAIHRIQPYKMVASVVENLRRSGIQNINCDLVYGLPFQSQNRFVATLMQTLSLAPSRIALFSYAHMPQVKKHQKLIETEWLPTPVQKLKLYSSACEILEANGYIAIGIDHFAKADDSLTLAMQNGQLRRNFQGYVTNTTEVLIGIGSSAISQFPLGYTQNQSVTSEYIKRINQGELASSRGWNFTKDDIVRKHIIDTLMCFLSVDLEETCNLFELNNDIFATELTELQNDLYKNIVAVEGKKVYVITSHRMATRLVAAVFDQYQNLAKPYSKVA